MRICKFCEKTEYVIAIQSHHIVSRKQQPALINCKLNLIDVCVECHTSGVGALHNGGFKKLKKIRLELQREYYKIFNEEFYSKEVIKDILEIKQNEVDRLLKTVPNENGLYEKEDVIRACMGGKLMLDIEI